MQSITIDILNAKALKLLKDLESLQLIRLHKESARKITSANWAIKYKGAMPKQPMAEINEQLNELRNEWE